MAEQNEKLESWTVNYLNQMLIELGFDIVSISDKPNQKLANVCVDNVIKVKEQLYDSNGNIVKDPATGQPITKEVPSQIDISLVLRIKKDNNDEVKVNRVNIECKTGRMLCYEELKKITNNKKKLNAAQKQYFALKALINFAKTNPLDDNGKPVFDCYTEEEFKKFKAVDFEKTKCLTHFFNKKQDTNNCVFLKATYVGDYGMSGIYRKGYIREEFNKGKKYPDKMASNLDYTTTFITKEKLEKTHVKLPRLTPKTFYYFRQYYKNLDLSGDLQANIEKWINDTYDKLNEIYKQQSGASYWKNINIWPPSFPRKDCWFGYDTPDRDLWAIPEPPSKFHMLKLVTSKDNKPVIMNTPIIRQDFTETKTQEGETIKSFINYPLQEHQQSSPKQNQDKTIKTKSKQK